MTSSLRTRLRAGDPEAFRELFQDMAQAVHALALRATGDRTVAEDVVSLTFLEVWRLREKMEPGDGSVRPWVYGVATNVLRNRGRAARRHQQALARLPLPEDVPDVSIDVVGRIDDGVRLAAARKALGRLRRAEREVFLLCVWSDLGYAAAAEALGIPIGTVRSRLSRARARLRKLTDEELEKARWKPEPPSSSRQIPGDRGFAVGSTQERAR
ncbi:RNA polymerase sigma factor [Streptomyces sp. NPDC086091]|uniref:RNA polymerase sigma factor n=1 Tax=Streptomyces sp. NPDC086091 TaxID=3365751 RepID=UPI0037F60C9B